MTEIEELKKQIKELKKKLEHHEYIDELYGRKQTEWWQTPYGKKASSSQTHRPYKVRGYQWIEHIVMARCPEEADSLFRTKTGGLRAAEIGREKIAFTCPDCGKIVYDGEKHGEVDEEEDTGTYSICLACFDIKPDEDKDEGVCVWKNGRLYEGKEIDKHVNDFKRSDEELFA